MLVEQAFDGSPGDDPRPRGVLSIYPQRAGRTSSATRRRGQAIPTVRFDAADRIIGIAIVNARKLIDAEGGIRITLSERISAAEIAPALAEA